MKARNLFAALTLALAMFLSVAVNAQSGYQNNQGNTGNSTQTGMAKYKTGRHHKKVGKHHRKHHRHHGR